jgi:hypothetical protein
MIDPGNARTLLTQIVVDPFTPPFVFGLWIVVKEHAAIVFGHRLVVGVGLACGEIHKTRLPKVIGPVGRRRRVVAPKSVEIDHATSKRRQAGRNLGPTGRAERHG